MTPADVAILTVVALLLALLFMSGAAWVMR